MAEEKYTGDKKTLPEKEVNKTRGPRRFKVTYTKSNTFELYVKRVMYRFEGSVSHMLSEEEINHPDFKQQEKYFSVIEVK